MKTNLRINILDVDECLDHPCHQNGTCINTIGSFDCECKEGFMGSGFICEGNLLIYRVQILMSTESSVPTFTQ